MSEITPEVDHITQLDRRIQATEIAIEKFLAMIGERHARGGKTVAAFEALKATEALRDQYVRQRAQMAELKAAS